MKANFPPSLKEVLKHEGGYVNHPKDPGGATNKGITQKTYDAYRKSKGQPARTVKEITDAEVSDCYRRDYWNVISLDGRESGVDLCLFDLSVNSGPGKAKQLDQATASVAPPYDKVKAVCAKRMAFLRSLGTFQTFGKGWTRRVTEVEALACSWALKGSANKPLPKPAKEELNKEADKAANDKNASSTAAGGAAAGGASTAAVDWSQHKVIIIIGLVVVAGLVIFFVRRAWVQRQREQAFRKVAGVKLLRS